MGHAKLAPGNAYGTHRHLANWWHGPLCAPNTTPRPPTAGARGVPGSWHLAAAAGPPCALPKAGPQDPEPSCCTQEFSQKPAAQYQNPAHTKPGDSEGPSGAGPGPGLQVQSDFNSELQSLWLRGGFPSAVTRYPLQNPRALSPTWTVTASNRAVPECICAASAIPKNTAHPPHFSG